MSDETVYFPYTVEGYNKARKWLTDQNIADAGWNEGTESAICVVDRANQAAREGEGIPLEPYVKPERTEEDYFELRECDISLNSTQSDIDKIRKTFRQLKETAQSLADKQHLTLRVKVDTLTGADELMNWMYNIDDRGIDGVTLESID